MSTTSGNVPSGKLLPAEDQTRQQSTNGTGSDIGTFLASLSIDDRNEMDHSNNTNYGRKRVVLEKIDERIEEYQSPSDRSTPDCTQEIIQNGRSLPTEKPAVRRVFHIAELLDMILDLAGPEAQRVAYNFSSTWSVPRWRPPRFLPHTPRWVDLSQFKLNPYLVGLFPGRFEARRGEYQIALRPAVDPQKKLINTSLVSKLAFERLDIGNLSVPQPPIKELCLKIEVTWDRSLTPKEKTFKTQRWVEDSKGITIKQLLDALEAYADQAVAFWIKEAKYMREAIVHLEDDSLFGTKTYEDVWRTPGKPKIVLSLYGNSYDEDASLRHGSLLCYPVPREIVQAEWMA
ncbi:hypothetical protein K491DRAFT_714338 [Lophiostoma macrostomum CBS 122681]|uniref:Uncharacterized protein n=1 Tax=Lophiostoma macrostomum CBS 122681 TaxID=1314788 RepID=A0A6A6TCD8_9PLEO|nr:hypothetical protein K491DRAFT_714338 [Lophiostoma macrostomum CBS 122681]